MARRSAASSNQSKIILNAEKGRSEATQSRHAKLHDERIERSATQATSASAQLERVAPLAIVTAEPQAAHNPLLHLAALELPFGSPNPLSLTLNKGERLAVVGDNGCGKSALLRVITRQMAAKSGNVSITPSHRFMDQHFSFLDQQQSVLDNFRRLAAGWSNDAYRTRLAQLRLRGDAAIKPLHNLSGGEQLKVALACLFCGPTAPALLLLDEPDNHLDIESRELLQQALHDYKGALVVVSHDRHFIDAIGGVDYLSLS